MFWNDLVMDDMVLSCRWMLNRLWNVDRVVDECQPTMKYWSSCWRMSNRLW
jgi:hypothetical protein